MSGERGYASVPERITWTTGFRLPVDKVVLGALSTFANFETGKGARVRVKTLAARAQLKPRRVQRSLHHLEADHWIKAVRRQHKGATSWDINVDKLATSWVAMKVVGGVMPSFPQAEPILNVTDDAQLNVTGDAQLNVTADVQEACLNVTGDVQGSFLNVTPDVQLNVTGDAQIPCTERSPVQHSGSPVEQIPSAPALRAGSGDDADENRETPLPPWEEFNRAVQSKARAADVRADRRADSNDAVDDVAGRRSDHPAAPGYGVPLRQGADLPSPESADRPRAPVEPTQQTFGPIDVSPSDEQHRQFMADLRSRIGLPTSADAAVKERKSG